MIQTIIPTYLSRANPSYIIIPRQNSGPESKQTYFGNVQRTSGGEYPLATEDFQITNFARSPFPNM